MKPKKVHSGEKARFISQKMALRKLQLSLPNYRRLCILKGIYPQTPKHLRRINNRSSEIKTYYHRKDVVFLSHEPIIDDFRRIRKHFKMIKHHRERGDAKRVKLIKAKKPFYSLSSIVKERYPTPQLALEDLDDHLNIIFLFAKMPRAKSFSPGLIHIAKTLSMQFLNLVIYLRAVRKSFITVRGFYVQADINGHDVTWIIPHSSTSHVPSRADMHIMGVFLEFAVTLIGSLLARLYREAGLVYPPSIKAELLDNPAYFCSPYEIGAETLRSLVFPLPQIKNDDTEMKELMDMDEELSELYDLRMKKVNSIKCLFEEKKFFLSREIPKDYFCFLIRSCGGVVSWPNLCGLGYTFQEDDDCVDYIVKDRPVAAMDLSKTYVQPQWIVDSLNQGELLPTGNYAPNSTLPPHLSPFEDRKPGATERLLPLIDKQKAELGKMLMSKKNKRLYQKMTHRSNSGQ